MIKIAVGGQLEQEKIKNTIEKNKHDKYEITVLSDMEAAMKVKTGEADYYIGACNTGGGGALAMAIALLGAQKCVSVSTPSSKMDEEEIIAEIENGKVAFGLLADTIEEIVPKILKNLK